MAVLERIRSRMGILVSIIIGLSLIAFVLSDMLTGNRSIFSKNEFNVAEIDGKSINVKEYDGLIDQLSEVYKFQSGQTSLSDETLQSVREQSWQQLLEENVLKPAYDEIGLAVSSKEVLDMVQGANPHPYVTQLFTNPETKEFNRGAVIQFIKSLETEKDKGRKDFWLYFEGQIMRERIQNKYYNLLRKGLYVTNDQLKADTKDNSKKVTFNYVASKFAAISDSSIQVKESELKAYLDKHKMEFEQEASRDIEYITYEVKPSDEDYALSKKAIDKVKDEFYAATDIKQYVNLNSDETFVDKYLKESELTDTLKKTLFDAKIGTSVGPYFENMTYKIARLADTKNIPDSVKARHILIRPEAQTKEATDKAEKLADSLKTVLKKGGKFEELAKLYSKDGSASKGGDLGWFKEGAMVKPFSDACFSAKKGDLMVVKSQFGVHVIELTERGKEVKKVQIGIVEKRVEASNATIQSYYQKASSFAGNNNTGDLFVSAVKKQGIAVKQASYLNESMREVQGIPNSRELVRWAFKAEPNTISGVLEFGDKFVIARIAQIREKGYATLDQVKDQIALLVKKDKKADQLLEKMKKDMAGANSISDLGSKLNLQLETAADITFNSYAIPGAGFEPALVATATCSPANKLSAPVKGYNAVYVVYVTNEANLDANDTQMSRMRMAGQYVNRVSYEAYASLKKEAEIKDYRIKFY